MVDKQKAIQLRELGLGYKEISEELGCSVQWCKVNLKDIQKNTKEKDLIARCTAMGLRPEGVTTVEIRREIVKNYDVLDDEGGLTADGLKLYKKVKSKVKEQKGTVIRPIWLDPKNVDAVFKAVLQAVDTIDRRIDEEILGVISVIKPVSKDYESTYKSLETQIFNLTHLGRFFTKKDLRSTLESLEEAVIELRKRVTQIEAEEIKIEGFELDEECKAKLF